LLAFSENPLKNRENSSGNFPRIFKPTNTDNFGKTKHKNQINFQASLKIISRKFA
jgi:hypothetical protein